MQMVVPCLFSSRKENCPEKCPFHNMTRAAIKEVARNKDIPEGVAVDRTSIGGSEINARTFTQQVNQINPILTTSCLNQIRQ